MADAQKPVTAGSTAERLLAAIVESSDDAILAKDLDGIIRSWNRGAERLYGYKPEEIIGRPVATLLPADRRDDVIEVMQRIRRGERIQNLEVVRARRDGRLIDVSLTISPIRDEAGRIVGASTIARDITDRKLEERQRRALAQLGSWLGGVLEVDQLLRELAAQMVPEWADYCVTYLVEGERIARVGTAHADPRKEAVVRRLGHLAPPTLSDQYGAGSVIRTGEPMLAAEVPEGMLELVAEGEYLDTLRALSPVSSMVLPLRARDRTVGAIAFAMSTDSHRRYTSRDLVFGQEIANRAALAVDNARLYGRAQAELALRQGAERELRRRFEQLRVLFELSEAVGQAGGSEEIYAVALDGLHRALDIDRASILIFDAEGVMRFAAWKGLSEEYRRAVDGHSPWSRDERDPAPIVIADVASDPGLEEGLRRTILDEGIRSMAFVPLVFGSQLLGKFMLYRNVPQDFDREALDLVRAVARTISFAITRMRDEQSLRAAKEAAERGSEAKSQFLGIMSHELRTPLNAVIGYADLLLMEIEGTLTPRQRDHLERVQVSARHQLELIEELLTYTRLEAGREEPRLVPTDVRRVLADILELLRPEAQAKGLGLRMTLPEERLQIVTDPARFRQIALNLTGNAVKYTEQGSVTIRVEIDADQLAVHVQDTGVGIPEDKLDYIFEPFAQVDESRTRVKSGTGLGLAIARRFATLLGGDVTVSSVLGRGSTFTLRLPVVAAPPS